MTRREKGGGAVVDLPLEGVTQAEKNEGHRQGKEQVPVIGVFVFRSRLNVAPGDIRRQPDMGRPEDLRDVARHVHLHVSSSSLFGLPLPPLSLRASRSLSFPRSLPTTH